MTKKTYLYFIQIGFGSVKVGVSSNPESRLKTLQTGCSKPLRLLVSIPFDSRKEAFALEKQLHEKYDHLRCRGEWFRPQFLREFRGSCGTRMIGGTNKNPEGGLLGPHLVVKTGNRKLEWRKPA